MIASLIGNTTKRTGTRKHENRLPVCDKLIVGEGSGIHPNSSWCYSWLKSCISILLVVSTHLKKISQIGNLPQVWVNIKNDWNHHLGISWARKKTSDPTHWDWLLKTTYWSEKPWQQPWSCHLSSPLSHWPHKFLMEPENDGFQKGIFFSRDCFSGSILKFWGCHIYLFKTSRKKKKHILRKKVQP